MPTNKEQISYLIRQMNSLGAEIENLGLEDECMRILNGAKNNPGIFREITRDEWETMLGKERQKNLPAYYCSCRLRYKHLESGMPGEPKGGKLATFLEGPYVQTIMKVTEIVALAELVMHAAHASGLFAHEDRAGDGPP